MVRNFGITGVGMYVPERIVTNEEIESRGIGSSAKWIYDNTGVKERRIVNETQMGSDLGIEAAKEALKNANLSVEDIDLIAVGTLTPDYAAPHSAAIIKQKLNATKAACIDNMAGCAGMMFALINAVNYAILNEEINNILVIGTDVGSKITDWTDRKSCSINADGSGAFVVQRVEESFGIKKSYIHHKDMKDISCAWYPIHYGQIPIGSSTYLQIDGRYIFERIKEYIPFVISKLLEKVNWKADEVNFLALPQPNKNLVYELMKSVGISQERTCIIMHKYGYTLNSCIPIVLYDALLEKKVKKGDKVILISSGIGIYCAGVAMVWAY